MRTLSFGWAALISALALLATSCVPAALPTPQAASPRTSPRDTWEVAGPGAVGFDSRALEAVIQDSALPGRWLHAVLVERHGRLVAERYFGGKDARIDRLYGIRVPFSPDTNFGPEVLHDARSISKSVVSLLLGTFMGEGGRLDLDGPAAAFFPDLKLGQDDRRRTITLRNLLTMSSGLDWHEEAVPNDETRLYWKADIVTYVLAKPLMTAPGTRFQYNSGGVAVLAEILVKTGGEPLTDLVRERLFAPMGITIWDWVGDIHGRPLAFTGLRLLPRDMLKLGRLMLNGGAWHGRQIVSSDWVAASMKEAIGTGHEIPPGKDGELTYGYLWWSGFVSAGGRSFRWVAAFGNGGQRIYVVPALDLSVVITAGSYGSEAVIPKAQALFQRIVSAAVPAELPNR